jgi:hypothetical protein
MNAFMSQFLTLLAIGFLLVPFLSIHCSDAMLAGMVLDHFDVAQEHDTHRCRQVS